MDINKYLNLVPTENSRKLIRIIDGEEVQVDSNFMKFVKAVLNHAVLLGDTTDSIGDAFDLMNAAGNQLDVIGELVGVSRLLSFVPLIGDRRMDDDEYRVFIFMKIFRNEWDGTMEGAINIYKSAFKDVVRIEFYDDGDCHVNVSTFVWSTRLAQILNSIGVLLIPAGVGKTVNVVNEITIEVGIFDGIIGTRSELTVPAVDSESFNVEDIEDLNVENLQWRYVRRIE